MRLPFLILTPVCIFLAASLVSYEQINLDFMVLFLALVAALFAHISVNSFNEYLDYTSGLDAMTKRTPFSGGSGALVETPQMKNWVLFTSLLTLLVTITIGLFFSYFRGPLIFVYGFIGVFLILAYTRWLNRFPLACLIAPGLGFGTVMVTGGHFALSGTHTIASICLGLMVFFQVNNLLLLNQFPDIEADKKVGRNHVAIRYGVETASNIYGFFAILSGMSLLFAVLSGALPQSVLLALLPISASVYCLLGAKKYGKALGQHTNYLAANTAITLSSPALICILLALS